MNCIHFILLLLCISTFGQTYNSALSDYEVEDFITWEIENSKDTTNYFAGQEKQLPYYTKSKNWTDLMVIFEYDRETVFEGLFREVLADSTLQIKKREIARQYQEIKKDMNFDFIKQIKEIKWTNKLVKSTPTITYSVPITNKQKDIIIVCKDYAFSNGNATIRGEYYIKIYLKSNGTWKLHRSLACGY
jgi:hypothetical protein